MKFTMDVCCFDNLLQGLKPRIISVTVWKILKRQGISEPGQATAQEFMATQS